VTEQAEKERCANAIVDTGLLSNRNLLIRLAAVETLHKIAPAKNPDSEFDMVALLIPLLEDWEEPCRVAVEETLGEIVEKKDKQYKEYLKAIIERLEFFKAGVRVAALRTLARISPEGQGALIGEICKLVEDPDLQVRAEAVKTLVAIFTKKVNEQGKAKAFKELNDRLDIKKKHRPDVRLTALSGYIQLLNATKSGDGDDKIKKAIEVISGLLLNDPLPEIRHLAAVGLAQVSPPNNAETMIAFICALGQSIDPGELKKTKKEQEEPGLPGQVEEEDEDEDLTPPLLPNMDEDMKVRLACVEGLAIQAKKTDNKPVLTVLAKELGDPEGLVRRAALEAFVSLAGIKAAGETKLKGDSFSLGLLIGQLDHRLGDVRYLAITAIAELGRQNDKETVDAVAFATKDTSAEVRKIAVTILPSLAPKGHKDVISGVVSCMDDDRSDIRLAALITLRQVSNKGDIVCNKTYAAAVRTRLQDRDRNVQLEAQKVVAALLE